MPQAKQIDIKLILPQGDSPVFHGFAISGTTDQGRQNIQVYYEIPANGVMSANLPTVSDENGKWHVTFPGDFTPGTEITAYARNGNAALAQLTAVL